MNLNTEVEIRFSDNSQKQEIINFMQECLDQQAISIIDFIKTKI